MAVIPSMIVLGLVELRTLNRLAAKELYSRRLCAVTQHTPPAGVPTR
jgi:hypothetical protein